MSFKSEPSARSARGGARSVEWPTVALTAACYGAFGLVTWHHAALPWWLLLPIGGFLVALHGSLQHEAVHGHPTPWPVVNEALMSPSLWLWMPFRIYRMSHLEHHRDESLTDPLSDPESYYVTPEAWARMGWPERGLRWALNTLLGRLLLGPLVCVWRLYAGAAAALYRGGEGQRAGAWLLHLGGVAVVLAWVMWICGMGLGEYVAFFAYPGLSLTLLRSFLEHQAREPAGERSVLIEAGPLMSLLFLNNNLHALHHAEPGLAWYRLPARYRERREELLAGNGHYRYGGYLEIFRRYLLRPKEAPAHPLYHAPAFALLRAANDPGPASEGERVA